MSDAPDTYLIWSHKHGFWWGPHRAGYVRRLSEAGRYSRAEALMLCTNSIEGTADRIGALPNLPVRLCDVLLMLRDPTGGAYVPGREAWE